MNMDASVTDAAASDASTDGSTDGSSSTDNQAPVAYDDEVSVGEDGPPRIGDVPVATDADGLVDADGYALVDEVETGVLVFDSDGSYVFDPGGALDSLPAAGLRSLSFRYTARDDDGAPSAPATISIVVTGVNDAPEVNTAIADQSTTAGVAFQSVLPGATFVDADIGDALTWSASGLPAWLSFDAATRTLHGTPQAADVGTATLTITVADAASATAQDSFTLEVLASPTQPIVEQYTYDAAGRLTQVVYGSARTVTYVYDPAGNVLQQEVVAP
jgi:YD repeat-containing protein/VCBS repeat-containing protein